MSSFRTYGGRVDWRFHFPQGIKTIIIACSAVFFLQTLFSRPDAHRWIDMYFGLVPRLVTNFFFIWQLVTYLFLHADIWHLLFNMLFLWMFGADLDRAWGTRRFATYYFVCGVGAGVVDVLVRTIVDPHGRGTSIIPTIGASGAIFGVLLAAAIIFPERRVWILPLPISIPMRVYALIMGALELYFSFRLASGDNVSHVCHLGGMLFGYLYLRRGSYLYGVRNRYSDWQRRRLRRKFEVYVRKHQDKPPSRPDNWVN